MADLPLAAPQGWVGGRQQMIADAIADLVESLELIYEESVAGEDFATLPHRRAPSARTDSSAALPVPLVVDQAP